MTVERCPRCQRFIGALRSHQCAPGAKPALTAAATRRLAAAILATLPPESHADVEARRSVLREDTSGVGRPPKEPR
jgi:hypothetical protein